MEVEDKICGSLIVVNMLTLSVSTSDMISLIVASSPMPYSFMAVSSSSLVMNLHGIKDYLTIQPNLSFIAWLTSNMNGGTHPLSSLSKYWKAL